MRCAGKNYAEASKISKEIARCEERIASLRRELETMGEGREEVRARMDQVTCELKENEMEIDELEASYGA
jgi:peptidoglycan hydrolase CwlO-like protein